MEQDGCRCVLPAHQPGSGTTFASVCIPWEDENLTERILNCSRDNSSIKLKNMPFTRPGRPRGFLDIIRDAFLRVPEGRLRIAQDFSPGPVLAENLLESRRDGRE